VRWPSSRVSWNTRAATIAGMRTRRPRPATLAWRSALDPAGPRARPRRGPWGGAATAVEMVRSPETAAAGAWGGGGFRVWGAGTRLQRTSSEEEDIWNRKGRDLVLRGGADSCLLVGLWGLVGRTDPRVI
jgi:hypothetical protein